MEALDALAAAADRAFAEAGAERPVLLRGPALARWLYDEPQERRYGDADLLVRPRDSEAAARALEGLGLVECERPPVPGERPARARLWRRAADGAAVELHETLLGVGVAPESAWEVLAARTQPMEVGGGAVLVLDEPARALTVALHAAGEGAAAQKPLADLVRALGRVDADGWLEAAELARQLEADAAFAVGLRLVPGGAELVRRLNLPAAAPAEILLRAAGPSAVRGPALTLDWITSRPGVRAKARAAVRELVPPPEVMRAWSPLARRGAAGLAAAHLARWVRVLALTAPALAAWLRARRASARR